VGFLVGTAKLTPKLLVSLIMWQYLFIYLEGFAYHSIFIDIYENAIPSFFPFLLFKRKIKFVLASVASLLCYFIKAHQEVRTNRVGKEVSVRKSWRKQT
jgi:hypothetical protein